MGNLMENLIYIPLYNLLIFLFTIFHDMGLAVILLTILVRLILIKQSVKAEKSRLQLQKLQPEIEKIKEKYKDNKEQQTKEMLALYQAKGINPFSSCLPTLFQLPFLIGLFIVFKDGLKNGYHLYDFVKGFLSDTAISSTAFGFLDLTATPNNGFLLILPIMAAGAQFIQSKMMITKSNAKGGDPASSSMNTIMLLFPVVTLIFTMSLPSALSLYWIATTLFAITQQYIIDKKLKEADKKA